MSEYLVGEDLLGVVPKQCTNLYWNSILQVINQYQQVVQMQKKEIFESIEQNISKRKELIVKYIEYKESLKYEGQTVKKDQIFIDTNDLQKFFRNYHHDILIVIEKALMNPQALMAMSRTYQGYRKYNFDDFAQNLSFMIYPYFNPKTQNGSNSCLQLLKHLIKNWDYNIDLCRPKMQTFVDQIIYGFLKTPDIVSYIERISMKFLQKINQCKMMNSFIFDEDAIKIEQQSKKLKTVSYNPPPKRNIFQRFFKKNRQDDLAFSNSTQEAVDAHNTEDNKIIQEIMKKRKQPFLTIITYTIELIINQEPPLLLKEMLRVFHDNIIASHPQQEGHNMLKHYCYFTLTNFILSELHSKFTISHAGNSMTNADLQNISEIIKVITCVFQGHLPDSDKYKTIEKTLKQYYGKISLMYERMINFQQKRQKYELEQNLSQNTQQTNKKTQNEEINIKQNKQISIMLDCYYQRTIFLSFNDIKILIDMLQSNPNIISALNINKNMNKIIEMLQTPQSAQIFFSQNKIKYQNKSFIPQNIIFIIRSSNPSQRQILNHYAGRQSPLKHLPFITNTLMNQSNLTVSQTLEVVQSLNLTKRLPLKQTKYYLQKMSVRFNNLKIKNTQQLKRKFEQSLKSSLHDNLERKALILVTKDKIGKRMDEMQKFIQYFKNELKSSAFYQKISQKFINNIKIKVYLNIQNNVFKVHKNFNEIKTIKIGNLMVSKNIDNKSTDSNDDYVLRNSFKYIDNIKDFIQCFSSHIITQSALLKGRKVEEFNQAFTVFCQLVVSYIEQFLAQQEILQNLNKQKFASVVVGKLQQKLYQKYYTKNIKVTKDEKLSILRGQIDLEGFYQKDLKQLNLQRQFLLEEGCLLLKSLMEAKSIHHKIYLFQEFFKAIFTIIAFSIKKNKISAEIINPIIQYLILSKDLPHYQCLYSMQCLKWRQSAETNYNLTLYQSSLAYISENMAAEHSSTQSIFSTNP